MREGPNTRKDADKINPTEKPKIMRHLADGVSPIMVCWEESKETRRPPFILNKTGFDGDFAHKVQYSDSIAFLRRLNLLHGGEDTYAFSVIDERDKFSESLCDCTGLVVAGMDKPTGKNISFLSHQDPKQFLFQKKDYNN